MNVSDHLLRLIERFVATLEVAQSRPKRDDALADRIEPTALKFETLDRLLHVLMHLVSQRRQLLVSGMILFLDLLLTRGDLFRLL